MKIKQIGWLGLVLFLITLTWIILLILSDSTTLTPETIDEKIVMIQSEQTIYTISYLNAGSLTFFNIMFMSALYLYCKENNEFWSTVSFVFVPIYGIANLFSYLSQIFLVPELLQLYQSPATQQFARLLLSLTIHTWPGSIVEAINGMAYALLGIPSIILPLIGLRGSRLLAVGGFLLIASGILSIIAFLGILTSIGYLTNLSTVGGAVFLFSLLPISFHFLTADRNQDQ